MAFRKKVGGKERPSSESLRISATSFQTKNVTRGHSRYFSGTIVDTSSTIPVPARTFAAEMQPFPPCLSSIRGSYFPRPATSNSFSGTIKSR